MAEIIAYLAVWTEEAQEQVAPGEAEPTDDGEEGFDPADVEEEEEE